MHPIIRNSIAIIAGLLIGSMVNMGIIMISGSIIPPPEGADISTMQSLKASMHLFLPKHFIFPFLAHALGTLAGAFITSLIAAKHKLKFALAIGTLFFIGGTINVFMLPSPLWFALADLALAYIPMAWIGYKLIEAIVKK